MKTIHCVGFVKKQMDEKMMIGEKAEEKFCKPVKTVI